MAGPFVLSEAELDRRSQCVLYQPASMDLLVQPSQLAFEWALRKRLDGKIIEPPDLREKFIEIWAAQWGKPEKDASYWEGPQAARPFARRVYEFLLRHEVVHPFEPYQLELDSGVIAGRNAVVLRQYSRAQPVEMVVDVQMRVPRIPELPHLPALAQWMAARQESEALDLAIVHVPLIRGESWISKTVDEALARTWLDGMVREAAANSLFPRLGTAQCRTCTQPCKEVFRGQNDNRWD